MDGAAFISALGGALSLFLGISLSMIFEVFEFMFDLSINVCMYCSKGRKKELKNDNIMKPRSAGFDYKEPTKEEVKISME